MKYKIYSFRYKKRDMRNMQGLKDLKDKINPGHDDKRKIRIYLCSIELPINDDDYYYLSEGESITDFMDDKARKLANKMFPNKDIELDRLEFTSTTI